MAAIIRASNDDEEKAALERGLVRISREEAMRESMEITNNWTPESEVFFLKYGAAIPAALSAVPGIFFTEMVRTWNRVPLKHGGRLLTVLPATMIAIGTSGFTYETAKNDIFVNKTRCPVCLDMRVAAYQGLIQNCREFHWY